MLSGFNLSATLNVIKLLWNPKLCLPQSVISNFNQLPIPIHPNIKLIVLDKDNCFAYPYDNKVWPEYEEIWQKLKASYPNGKLLIVSNSAGTDDDINHKDAQLLEQITGVPVLRHSTKKPGCKDEILKYCREKNVTNRPDEIAVVGDRLFTDILMANLMGSYSIWIRDGVKISSNPIVKLERSLYTYLTSTK